MEWYVYRHDTNKGTIYEYNALQPMIIEEIRERMEITTTLSDFKEILEKVLRYYYWGKCEHEVIIKEWTGKPSEVKIDIFDQLRLNWEVFCLYVWNSLIEEGIDFSKKEKKEKEDVQREDVCKDCLCRTCKAIDCSGCGDCSKADWNTIKECKFYEEKEIPGYWVHNESGDIICNKCENYPLESNGRVYLSDYCPFCGHRMENCSCGFMTK